MLNKRCRYIDCEGICTLENKLCDSCGATRRIKYEYKYNPFTGTTQITVLDKGNRLMSIEVIGLLNDVAVKAYATDMCRILVKKGVIK